MRPIELSLRQTFGAKQISKLAPAWVRIASLCGLIISLLAIVFTVFPIIGVRSPLDRRGPPERSDPGSGSAQRAHKAD